jgi:hypothetical protein
LYVFVGDETNALGMGKQLIFSLNITKKKEIYFVPTSQRDCGRFNRPKIALCKREGQVAR